MIPKYSGHNHFQRQFSGRLAFIAASALVAIIGSILLLRSHAATATISLEAEQGFSSGNTTTISDQAASSQQAVRFNGVLSGGHLPPRVTLCDRALCINGQNWRPNGGSTNGNASGSQSASGNVAIANYLKVNVIRLTDFIKGTSPGASEYDAATWAGVDKTISIAAQNHLYVELDLSTYRNMLENTSSTLNMYTYNWTPFLTWVANRTNTVTGVRYGSDPTIAFVSFAGEVQTLGSAAYTARGISSQNLVDFFTSVCTTWGKLAPGQLRIPGGLFHMTDPNMPWRQIDSLPNCDLPAMHSYSPDDESMMAPLNSLAASLNKPWLLEEFGYTTANYPIDSDRATQFTSTYRLADSNHAVGSLFWNIDPGVGTSTHAVNSAYPLTAAAVQARSGGTAFRW